jgi:hypothetical protein
VTLLARDHADVEALLTDRYLESLFVAHERRAQDAPADPDLDPAVRRTAQRLSADLVRVHPSFRFEERLAARVAEAASRMRLAAAAGAEGAVVPLPLVPAVQGDVMDGRTGAGTDLGPDATTPGIAALPRPLIIGGALTSAAISLAGAAFVAWRFGRPPLNPMARAVRAAQQARLARSRLD